MALSLSRRGDVEPFHAMDVLAEANRLKALGQPVDLDGSRAAFRPGADGGARGSRPGACRWPHRLYRRTRAPPPARGDLRALSRTLRRRVSPARIAVTTGSSAAFNLAFLAMFDVGDRVAIAAPGYPAYRNILAALGLEVVEIETGRRRPSRLPALCAPRTPKSR